MAERIVISRQTEYIIVVVHGDGCSGYGGDWTWNHQYQQPHHAVIHGPSEKVGVENLGTAHEMQTQCLDVVAPQSGGTTHLSNEHDRFEGDSEGAAGGRDPEALEPAAPKAIHGNGGVEKISAAAAVMLGHVKGMVGDIHAAVHQSVQAASAYVFVLLWQATAKVVAGFYGLAGVGAELLLLFGNVLNVAVAVIYHFQALVFRSSKELGWADGPRRVATVLLLALLVLYSALTYLGTNDEARQDFASFDTNGNGFISPHELSHALLRRGEQMSQEEVAELIREADLDGDGLVSYDEFETHQRVEDGDQSDWSDVLERFDTDGNGFISAAELRQAFLRGGEHKSKAEVAELIREVDLDGNEMLSSEEYFGL